MFVWISEADEYMTSVIWSDMISYLNMYIFRAATGAIISSAEPGTTTLKPDLCKAFLMRVKNYRLTDTSINIISNATRGSAAGAKHQCQNQQNYGLQTKLFNRRGMILRPSSK